MRRARYDYEYAKKVHSIIMSGSQQVQVIIKNKIINIILILIKFDDSIGVNFYSE